MSCHFTIRVRNPQVATPEYPPRIGITARTAAAAKRITPFTLRWHASAVDRTGTRIHAPWIDTQVTGQRP